MDSDELRCRKASVSPETSLTESEYSLLDDARSTKDTFNGNLDYNNTKNGTDIEVSDNESKTVLKNSSSPSLYSSADDENSNEPAELNFRKGPENINEKRKREEIQNALLDTNYGLENWRNLAKSEYGLIDDDFRKEIWPKLLEIKWDPTEIPPSLEELSVHSEYNQVILDVNRSLKRFPPGIPYEQRVALQDQLTVLILRVIMKYPDLRYYQGYHDVAITFLLVVGEVIAFRIMERLSADHLRECMEPTMEKTSYRLNFIYPIIEREHHTLYEYLERSSVGTMFALPWYLTWFGHSLNHYKDVVRLYDYFLASPPLSPLYVSAALVIERADDIFKSDCDMASVHCLLNAIPDNLPFEKILENATAYYKLYPPEEIEKDVQRRIQNEGNNTAVPTVVEMDDLGSFVVVSFINNSYTIISSN
ncbi:TBC1 domain family member 20 isoform X2 [Chrysoperla carnea]|uniref:TBC1 domain family member 20 isoform X2 n=1 Tax=Chrysoperla carnea TaxID=189513 RepID=UPI001D065AF9|nr:TBC1 domain family member 20 isoform X2 [Chrysoperla carnea]